MCLMNRQPVIYAPCSGCSEFLNSCMPLIVDGLIFGECDDYSYCEFCDYYGECAAAESPFTYQYGQQRKGGDAP